MEVVTKMKTILNYLQITFFATNPFIWYGHNYRPIYLENSMTPSFFSVFTLQITIATNDVRSGIYERAQLNINL